MQGHDHVHRQSNTTVATSITKSFTEKVGSRGDVVLNIVGCNQMETVFGELSSWTALTWLTVMKTAFKNKNMKSKYFGIFNMKILNFKCD